MIPAGGREFYTLLTYARCSLHFLYKLCIENRFDEARGSLFQDFMNHALRSQCRRLRPNARPLINKQINVFHDSYELGKKITSAHQKTSTDLSKFVAGSRNLVAQTPICHKRHRHPYYA